MVSGHQRSASTTIGRDVVVVSRWEEIGGHLLSRLYRKAESLDNACLRAWGYPSDHGVRQELLDALQWESSLRPEHARASIRELFDQVQTCTVELAVRIRASADRPEIVARDVRELRDSLSALMEVLEKVRARP